MKFIFKFLISLIIVSSLALPLQIITSHATTKDAAISDAQLNTLPLIVDGANLLSDGEEEVLLKKLVRIKEIDDVEIVIVTRMSIGKKEPSEYARDFFNYNGYGPDSVVFLLSMHERVWAISTHGSATKTFDNDTINEIMNIVFLQLSGDHFYKAFELFIETCSSIIYSQKYDIPLDLNVANYKVDIMSFIPINVLIAFVLSRILINRLWGIRKADLGCTSGSGSKPNCSGDSTMSLTLTHKSDIFINSNTTKTKID